MPAGCMLGSIVGGPIPRDQLGKDVRLAHAAADQLAVLAAVVEHGDGLVLHHAALRPLVLAELPVLAREFIRCGWQ